jgi:hypothetical protein
VGQASCGDLSFFLVFFLIVAENNKTGRGFVDDAFLF